MRICKCGNSLGLRIPAAVAQVAGLKTGSAVGLRLQDNGSLLVTPQNVVAAEAERVTAPAVKPASQW
jgi:antitoxin component of MazEF toxin-antitoxin module